MSASGAPRVSSGLAGIFGLLTFVLAAMATYVALPAADVATSDWVVRLIVAGYGAAYLDEARLAWTLLLALLIFAVVRGILSLILSAASLAWALHIVAKSRRQRAHDRF